MLLSHMDLVVLEVLHHVTVTNGIEVCLNIVTTIKDESSFSSAQSLPGFRQGLTLSSY